VAKRRLDPRASRGARLHGGQVAAGGDPVAGGWRLLASDRVSFERILEEALEPQAEYLTKTERTLYDRGKRLRPMMLLLTARMVSGLGIKEALPTKVMKAAVALEMLHVATLIHDDIVDMAPTRRGLISVGADRGTEMAVLIGDLQFIQAIRCFAEDVNVESDMQLVRTVLDVAFKICCGELDELQAVTSWKTRNLTQRYYRTIDRKTAVLFGLACESGSTLVGGGSRVTWCVSQFGRLYGRAFQIMDDLLDLVTPDEISGKRRGSDIIERRLSLPIIYALGELPAASHLSRIIHGGEFSREELEAAIEETVTCAGFLRAYGEVRDNCIQAIAMLDGFPPSAYRDTLLAQAQHLMDRDFGDAGTAPAKIAKGRTTASKRRTKR
jgi:heptaprenyl diphosphate synthase